ncbi:MAG: putative toxin-antitoxin system toxin component, PIN family [Thermomicrobiales bacterium]
MSESSSRLRIAVDTNLFISSVILRRGNPYALRQAWQAVTFRLILSRFQRTEIADVLNRPKIAIKYGVSIGEREALLHRIDDEGELVDPLTKLPVRERDPKDEMILGTALAGDADYLVTGDEDLLEFAGDSRLGRLRIVIVVDFLLILDEHGQGAV